jgi:hypothetical protein
MTPEEYATAMAHLGLSHHQMAEIIGVSLRQSMRYASGENPVSEPVAKLIDYLLKTEKGRKNEGKQVSV